VVTPVADGLICGFGGDGYRLAAESVRGLLA
jgi:3-dehydroquinate dehydratase